MFIGQVTTGEQTAGVLGTVLIASISQANEDNGKGDKGYDLHRHR